MTNCVVVGMRKPLYDERPYSYHFPRVNRKHEGLLRRWSPALKECDIPH